MSYTPYTTEERYQIVEGVPGLVVGENSLYIPQDLAGTLWEPPDISIDEMASAASAIWDTGDANDTTTSNFLKETNAVPQPSHVQALHAIRSRCEAEMSDLGTEIQRVHQQITDLTQKLTWLSTKHIQKQNLASACTSFLSPLRRLPPETLGEIFLYSMPSHGRPVASEAPLLLAHICSAWRKAAFGFPLLWTNLSITTPEHPPRGASQNLANIIKLWFNCARTSPLTFKFCTKYDSVCERKDRSIVDAMIPHAGRFQKLHLSSVSIYDILGFVTLPPGHLNMLESLQLEIDDFYELEETMITAFDEAPLLHELTLDLNTNPHTNLAVSWNKLTTLSTTGVALFQSDIISMLSKCTQFVSCTFRITTDPGEQWVIDLFQTDEPIVLENLTHLQVVLSAGDTPIERVVVFDKLALPALTSLLIGGVHSTGLDLSVVSLDPFLQRAPKIQRLTLVGFSTAHDRLLSVLRSTPCMTSLTLSVFLREPGYAPLMEGLTYVHGQLQVYVPSLKWLEISIPAESGDFQRAVPQFMAMVRSRQIMKTRVDEVTGKDIPPPVQFLCTVLRLHGSPIANSSSQLRMLRSADDDGVIVLYVSDDEEQDEQDEEDEDGIEGEEEEDEEDDDDEEEEDDDYDADGDDVIMHHL